MEPEETTEIRLLRGWRSGDRVSGDRLLRRYVPVLRAYFSRRITHNIDDLVQRTLLACVQSMDRYEGRSSFKTYLLGIAHRQLLMTLRSEAYAGFESSAPVTPPDDSPSQLAAVREEQFIVANALLKVELEFMLVLKLFYWGQRSIDEIAEELGVPAGTVKSRLARGRAMLKANVINMKLRPGVREEALREIAYFLHSRSERE
jgi:RNA polymerase sigma-70 factor (ECF subfamily)